MASPCRPNRAYPKISTMPRRQSESAHYLDIYKLTIEKKRLQQELAALTLRQQQVQQQLAQLDGQIESLRSAAEALGTAPAVDPPPRTRIYSPTAPCQAQIPAEGAIPGFNTLTLDY